MDQICFVCKKSSILDFKLLEEEVASFSGKALKMVLRHIMKCTQTGNTSEIVFDEFTFLCPKCYTFLIDYDEQVVKLMSLQKKFKIMFESAAKVCPKIDLRTQLEFEEEAMSCDEEFNQTTDQIKEEELEDSYSSGEEQNSSIREEDESTEYVTKELFACKYCPTGIFEEGEDLKQHILDFHTKKESVCTICNISLKDEEHLELHMNLHEGKTENECRYCDKRFTHKSSVIRHMAKHWDKKKYQCEKCGLRFSETPRLYNHKLLHEAEENPLICHICNQLCKTRRTYKRHMNTHREDRPRYPCHICGKTFSEKFTLKPHLRTHPEYVESTKEKNEAEAAAEKIAVEIAVDHDQNKESFICVICGAVFSDSEDNYFEFNKHMEKAHNVSSALQ